jgi:hypothetical protein
MSSCNNELSVADKKSDVLSCPVCFEDIDPEKKIVTSCGHTYCEQCMYQIHQLYTKMNCPLCRCEITNIQSIIEHNVIPNIPEYNLHNYPISPSFDFIQCENSRQLFSKAYNTIQRLRAWQTLRIYMIDETNGFMYCNSDEIRQIMNEIAIDNANHSGCTMGVTMRMMHFISQFGWTTFREKMIISS